jgi:decaprenylphospho-beta-D-ribofuranose 2-oxidase
LIDVADSARMRRMGWSNTKRRRTTYSGQVVWTRAWQVHDEVELRDALAYATSKGFRVAVRAGETAFDTHALHPDVTLELRGFDSIGPVQKVVAPSGFTYGTITVGANATWSRILEKTKAQGFVPYVMVSTSRATAGGTLSADCLSRFSPTCGKEGGHVESFRLMKVDGTVVVCSRTQNDDLFFGAIGGFGYVGVVLEVTYRLLYVGTSNIVVKTEFQNFVGLSHLAKLLVQEVAGQPASGVNRAPDEVPPLPEIPRADARAVSAVLWMNDERQGFVMRSTYEDGAVVKGKPVLFHQPKKIWHRLLQFAVMGDLVRTIGYEIMLDIFMKAQAREPAVDELEGFTFFQDGNDVTKRFLRNLGFPTGIRQETYVIPVVPGDDAATEARLAKFLNDADALMDARRLLPVLLDVLYLPAEGEGFALSSTRGLAGYAVTITFEELTRDTFPDEEAALADIAAIAHALGGRVHLVKNVYGDPGAIEGSYAAGITQLAALKATHDPGLRLGSSFLRRVLPSLA